MPSQSFLKTGASCALNQLNQWINFHLAGRQYRRKSGLLKRRPAGRKRRRGWFPIPFVKTSSGSDPDYFFFAVVVAFLTTAFFTAALGFAVATALAGAVLAAVVFAPVFFTVVFAVVALAAVFLVVVLAAGFFAVGIAVISYCYEPGHNILCLFMRCSQKLIYYDMLYIGLYPLYCQQFFPADLR
ncbi:MAG: hypothetical protein ACKV2V_18590 [Blastocatellia bacterium]